MVQMTAGAGLFPGDDSVDRLWIEMDAAAHRPHTADAPRWSQALRTGAQ